VRYVVVGAGIVGLAVAREIARRQPDATVVVVEKEQMVAAHQTSHNSGVVHAGIYYPPGSLKAQLCTRGRILLQDFCAQHRLDYVECGKLVVARGQEEIPALREIEERSIANQVPDIRWVDQRMMEEIEPHAAGVAGLHSPRTAIVSFTDIANTMAASLDVRLGYRVTSIRSTRSEIVVGGAGGQEVAADRAVVCAGLQSDRVARLAGDGGGAGIVPFRGEYWRLVPERAHVVRGLIYPVPDPRYPFLGVHFTRRVDGCVDVGPNAVLALAREGYRRRDFSMADVAAALRWDGFRRMARTHWRAGLRELRTSLSKRAFAASAATLVPSLKAADLVRAPAGVRAQAVDADGSLVDDFRISWAGDREQIMVVRNAPSPAATSSLAIAEHLVDKLMQVH
jgi:L-2-hydroxyglutarate oxidase LhgO